MNESVFNQFRITVAEKNYNVYGIVLYQKGRGSVSYRWRSDDRENVYSCSKTFTSLAVGMCIDEGRIKITDRVLDFFPEYKSIASEGTENITLRDLLHMASGKETYWFLDNEKNMYNIDIAELFLKEPMKNKAGEVFNYSNNCTYMLSRVVEKVSGSLLRDYLIPRLFTPLKIYNPMWRMCSQGHTLGASALYLTTEELSRLGRLMLDGGVWEDKRLISEEYMKNLANDCIDNKATGGGDLEQSAGYGYQIWRCAYDGAYRADGMYLQTSVVFPDKEAVITLTSHQEWNVYDVLRAVYKDIVAYL